MFSEFGVGRDQYSRTVPAVDQPRPDSNGLVKKLTLTSLKKPTVWYKFVIFMRTVINVMAPGSRVQIASVFTVQ